MRLHAIDVAADDLIVLAEADLVVLAAPARQNIALLEALDDVTRAGCDHRDSSSTKREIVAAARLLRRGFCRRPSARWSRRRADSSTRGSTCSAAVLAADGERRQRRPCSRS
jgi:hypothetical protein